MLMIFTMMTVIMLTPWLTPAKRLWEITTTMSLLTTIASTMWLLTHANQQTSTQFTLIDEISLPLLILTYWLTTPTLLASQSKLMKEPYPRQRSYIFTILLLQTTTMLAFTTNNIMMFFIMFETTVIPTLIIITRWGTQKERLIAGIYFLFYTLLGSMALLVIFIELSIIPGTLSIQLLKEIPLKTSKSSQPLLWWPIIFLAFLIKMPLYGLHLWLPKAHVEAPVAGSMILAATLLKLGGYGIIRMTSILEPIIYDTSLLTVHAMMGVILSAILCTRQTDLKSLIAFSSVSHMGLVIAASTIKTDWSIMGAMILMVSHGLTSSTLFCLANSSYERTHTRTMAILQGSQTIFPLTAMWWLMATLMNMALPPSINFIGEFLILSSLFHWSNLTLIMTGLGIIFTTIYSLHMFWSSQRELAPPHIKHLHPSHTREHITIALHIVPMIIIMYSPNILF